MSKIEVPKNDPINNGLSAIIRGASKNNIHDTAIATVNTIKTIMSFMDGGFNRLFQMVIETGRGLHQNAVLSEINRLSNEMVGKILIEKNIITEEEWKNRQQTEVIDVLEKIQKEAEEEAKKTREEILNKVEATKEKIEEVKEACEGCSKECNCEEHPDVILASERSNVIKFPSKKEPEDENA